MEIQKKHNFGAGPCILPQQVLEQAASAVLNWNGSGLSLLEISHRSPEFEDVVRKTELLVRELLKVPDADPADIEAEALGVLEQPDAVP